MVEHQLPKLNTGFRLPSPALFQGSWVLRPQLGEAEHGVPPDLLKVVGQVDIAISVETGWKKSGCTSSGPVMCGPNAAHAGAHQQV